MSITDFIKDPNLTISTPRSLEAMRRVGLTQNDLKHIPLTDLLSQQPPNEFINNPQAYFEPYFHLYESRRLKHIQLVVQVFFK